MNELIRVFYSGMGDALTTPKSINMETIMACASTDEKKLTWGEILQLIENAGVDSSDEIDKIDISWGSIEEFTCSKDEVFGWQIRL